MKKTALYIRQIENEQLSLVEKHALGKIEEGFYEKLMDKKKIELSEIKAERYKYGNYQEDLDKYLSFGLSMLKNLDFFYENATI